jgi:tRNA-specific 2-thiouridylase
MKIAVAMSGGVDSSAAAYILKQEGHDLIGITAICISADPDSAINACFTSKSITDAEKISDQLGIPHYTIDVSRDFESEIIVPFCSEYINARTPNPCVKCNPKIKFKKLIQFAEEKGYGKIATGHYASVSESPSGRFFISAAADKSKDQSYFLCRLSQDQLSRSVFPLGRYTKTEIRDIAMKAGLHTASNPESQEICFIPDNDYSRYIEKKLSLSPNPGDIVDKNGKITGRHNGIHRYTIGQRRGLGIAAPFPLYVIEIDPIKNIIIAGYKDELLCKGLYASDLNFMKEELLDGLRILVKVRSTQSPFRAKLKTETNGVSAYFEEMQSGITPGQSAVFYDFNGGIIAAGTIEKKINTGE